jgi:hypothetical protein
MKPMMRRATIVYICMFGLLIAGLWTILRIGNTLRPPHDLSGQWLVRPVEASPESEPLPMEITQSGRFLTVNFPKIDPVKVKFKKEEFDASGKVIAIHWESSTAKLLVRLPQPPKTPDEKVRYWFELEKPKRATWRARRLPATEVTAAPTDAAH